MKLWGGRFRKNQSDAFMRMQGSISFDSYLWYEEILSSIVYALALNRAGVLKDDEKVVIIKGLKELVSEAHEGKFFWTESDEDIHSAVERALFERIGEVAHKLHTGRSRNEQIVTDLRLYLKRRIVDICRETNRLSKIIIDKAEQHLDFPMPGFTHLQHAQPVLISHHLMAWFFMLERDFDRFVGCFKKIDICPLGSGALAGNSFGVDRNYISELLGFSRPSDNSIEAVSDRDFAIHFLSEISNLALHLSRFSEELVLWSTQEFSFVDIDEAYTTGSSLMPQKKNPDSVELIRAKSGRVVASWIQLATVLKGLPLAYNRDLQEDKEFLFDATNTVLECLNVFKGVAETLTFNVEKIREKASDEFLLATDLADYLVLKGIPFRQAHEISGKVVRYALEKKKNLSGLDISEYKNISEKFERDVFKFLSLERSIEFRNSYGGTAKVRVEEQITNAKNIISHQLEWIKNNEKAIIDTEKGLLEPDN